MAKSPFEIDNDLSQAAKCLTEEEKSIVRVVSMGGNQAKKEMADYNQDIEGICSYCMEADSTAEHVRWSCKHFDSKRTEIDAELAAIPLKYLPQCVRCGIAPAMKKVSEDETSKTKALLGVDREAPNGSNTMATRKR